MSCKVIRNSEGNIQDVRNEDGTQSRLFIQVASHPLVKNTEDALSLYKNKFSKKLPQSETEPLFTNRANGEIYNSYKDVLKNTVDGEVIESGLQVGEEFFPLLKTTKTTNKDLEQGYINHVIEQGYIKDTKKKINTGEYRFEAAGETSQTQIINSEVIADDAGVYLGKEGTGKDGYTFKLEKTRRKVKLRTKDGGIEYVDSEYFDTANFEEIKRKYGEDVAISAVTGREYAEALQREPMQAGQRTQPRTEQQLQLLLLNLLNKMGVKTMHLSEYVEKYKVKNGVDPSAQALSDIANQIIAYRDGEISIDQLTEETAHFITEAFPQEQIENLLRNIHRTEEWQQHADNYRKIYSKEYETAEQVEQAVRREVLGKVLANGLKNNFQGQTETKTNILQRLKEAFDSFIQRIQDFFKPQYKQDLENYIEEVQEILYLDDISEALNTDNFVDNKFRLYKVDPAKTPEEKATERIRVSLQAAVRGLRDQVIRANNKTGTSSSLERENVNRIETQLENVQSLEAITGLTAMVSGYIRRLEAAVQEGEKTPFTAEQNVLFQTLKNNLIPALTEIELNINKLEGDKATIQKIAKDIDSLGTKMRKLEGSVSLFTTEAIDNMVERVMQRHNLDEKYREYVQKWLESAEYDSTFFHANFGQITHSRDALLSLMGVTIKDIETETKQNSLFHLQNYLSELRSLGVSPQDISRFVDVEGGVIINERDYEAFNKAMNDVYLKNYKEIAPESDYKGFTDEQILLSSNRWRLENKLSEDQRANLRRNVKDQQQPFIERRMEDGYYNEFEEKFKKLGISQTGITYMMSYYRDLSNFHKKATKDGVIDLRNLSESDQIAYWDIVMSKKYRKSYYNELGNLKEGLMQTAEGDVVQDPNKTLSDSAQIALDLNKFESDYNEKDQERHISEKFYTMLKEAFEVSPEEGMRFLKLNAYTGFSSTFWDSLTESTSLKEKLQEVRNGDNMSDVDAIIEALNEKGAALKEILKHYKHKNNPAEIDVERMDGLVRERVKDLQQDLSEQYRKANALLPEADTETAPSLETETTTNESYRKTLNSLGIEIDYFNDSKEEIARKIKEQVEFARQHMTDYNAKTLSDAVYFMNKVQEGKAEGLNNKTVGAILEERRLEVDSLKDVANRAIITEDIIKRRLLPYYKRFAPAQYAIFTDAMLSTDNTAAQKVEVIRSNAYEFLEINPNPSFQESTGENRLNPNFDPNFYGGTLQPKTNLFKNQKFYDLFGEIKNKDKNNPLSTGESTKNPKLYQAYLATLRYNKVGLDAMGMGESYNYYTLPQIRKQQIQRVKDLTTNVSGRSIREAWEETLRFTEDDKIQGETQFGDSIKVIPNMFTDPLQNKNDVSTDLLYSLSARNIEGFRKQARMRHYGDMMALSDAIQSRSTGNGKDIKTSNTYKMMESYKNYSLFGVKESWSYTVDVPIIGEVDVAKIVRNLVKYIKFRNLGLNVIIPVTSLITGKVQLLIESIVQEHINRDSLKLGRREMSKLLKESGAEWNTIGKKGKLNVIMQYFRAIDMEDSLKNSSYNGLMRVLPKTGMGLHALSNYPLYGEAVLGTLYDYRIIDGTLMTRREFDRNNQDKTKADRDSVWRNKENQDNAIYNFIIVEDGQLSFDKEKLREKLTDTDGNQMSQEEFDNFLDNKIKGIQTRMGEIILNIDTQIPMETRVAAQRNALWSLFLTHRSYLITNISRRTRSEFYNLMTGEVEQGSYRAASNFIKDAVNEMRKTGSKNIIKAFSEQWKEADNVQKMNLKRVGVDMAILTTMAALGALIFSAADDEEFEDVYTLQLFAYFWMRLQNETSSVSSGSVGTLFDALESPIIGLNIVQGLVKFPEMFSGEEIKYGTYRGETERYRYLSRMLPLFSQYNYLNSAESLKQTRNTYRLFNRSSLDANPFSYMANKFESEE